MRSRTSPHRAYALMIPILPHIYMGPSWGFDAQGNLHSQNSWIAWLLRFGNSSARFDMNEASRTFRLRRVNFWVQVEDDTFRCEEVAEVTVEYSDLIGWWGLGLVCDGYEVMLRLRDGRTMHVHSFSGNIYHPLLPGIFNRIHPSKLSQAHYEAFHFRAMIECLRARFTWDEQQRTGTENGT